MGPCPRAAFFVCAWSDTSKQVIVPDLSDTIEDLAGKPSFVGSDGLQITERSLRELIEADKYLKAISARDKPRRGIRLTKLVPPGGD